MIFKSVLQLIAILVVMPSVLCQYVCNPATTTTSTIQLGKQIFICIRFIYHRNSTVDTVYAFNTTTDKYAALKVSSISTTLAQQSTAVQVHVQVANSNISLPVPVVIAGSSFYFRELYSFVINIDKGIVTAITDDTADCSNCDTSSVCNEATGNKCFKSGKYNGVDPRFFISWIGTDISGNYMLSHTKRLSRFTQYSVGNIYNSVISAFTIA